MEQTLLDGLKALAQGITSFHWQNGAMMFLGAVLLYLAIKKGVEPLLLLPIGFGAILINLPMSELMNAPYGKDAGGILWYFYETGVITEIFPCLIFIGIGAMTDFGPLLERPWLLLFGAAGQFGIFMTLFIALQLGFSRPEACAIGVIGACDGPTSIYFSTKYAFQLLPAISVAAYSYMALVPIIQPPIMHALTTDKERKIKMPTTKRTVSQPVKVIFPVAVTLITCIIAPKGAPLMGCLMLGNLLRESAVVDRLLAASQNEIANVVTLLLGLCIGASMHYEKFLSPTTILIFGLGLFAIIMDTVAGVVFGKILNAISGGKVNPLLGAAGISAFPMAARVVQGVGQKANPQNYLLMQAMGANTGGQIGSVMAAAVMLSVLPGFNI